MTSRAARWPAQVTLPPGGPLPTPARNEIVATWLGHASFLIQAAGANILIDPVFSERVSPFRWIGPKRVHPVPFRLESLPPIDVVCVSHDHYDHFDMATLRQIAGRWNPRFVGPLRHAELLQRAGARQVEELDWWQAAPLAKGIEVTLTPTKHWSKRLGTPRNHRLWGGFWLRVTREVDASVHNVWFVGDTGYDETLLRAVRERCGRPDLALIPIGAYEPRWFMAPIHINPEEAICVHQISGARASIAMHWGTFQLADDGYEAPVHELDRARRAAGIAKEEFAALAPGESLTLSLGGAGPDTQ